MEVRLQRPERADLSIRFTLVPFITDWASAQTRFITAVVRELGGLLSVRPQDFYTNPSMGLGEVWCKYRIFGGASTIVFRPDILELSFVNAGENDSPTILEIIRRSASILQQDIGDYAQCHVSLSLYRHVKAVGDGSADRYLNQFTLKQTADMVRTDSDIEYRPTVKVILSNKEEGWEVHQLVEKSDALPDGLFINTLIFIPLFELAKFDEQQKLTDRIFDLSNKAVGLIHIEDSNADADS
ncbi:MAG: hypothetical protein OXC18_18850 [Desulfurellaceae bacterium]|nr:hypothetical protein [Desulfurellaceae bacterium]